MITSNHTEFDLGDIKLGEKAEFDTLISNTYPFTVHLGVTPGCGSCTDMMVQDGPNISPNSTKLVRAIFTPKGTGAQVKSFRVEWVPQGETQLQKIVVRFKANVI